MAILYTFTVIDDRNTGAFPPSVLASDWYANFTNYVSFFAVGGNPGYNWALIFESKAKLNEWLDEYAIPDDLVADMKKWSVDQGVQYVSGAYELPAVSAKGLI